MIFVFMALMQLGCSTHYLVTSNFAATQKSIIAPPEIVQTPTYKSIINNVKSVAVRAPSSCSNKTSDQQNGSATSKEVVLATQCAVEMSLIERALSKASYKVISWTEFDRYSDKSIPIHKLANKMGAQVLFQVNSLEKSTKKLGNLSKDETLEYNYYISNDDGENLGQANIDEETKTLLKSYIGSNSQSIANIKVPFVTLDANAISTTDGETIWFYRNTYSQPTAVEELQKVLLDCNKVKNKCSIHDSYKEKIDKNLSDYKNKSTANNSLSTQPEDNYAAVYSSLLNVLIDNFVGSFSSYSK